MAIGSSIRLGLGGRSDSSSEASLLQKPQPIWQNPVIQEEEFVRTSAPERLPDPDTDETIDPGAAHAFQACIVDFHFEAIRAGGAPVVERCEVDDIVYDDDVPRSSTSAGGRHKLGQGGGGPRRIMRDRRGSAQQPDLRWVHLPFNSMQYAEAAMEAVCADLGLDECVARGVVMAPDKWENRLHRKTEADGYHATFMQTTCSEISIPAEFLGDVPEKDRAKFAHSGANVALFMPFLHWGTEAELDWRDDKIAQIEALRRDSRNGRFAYPYDDVDGEEEEDEGGLGEPPSAGDAGNNNGEGGGGGGGDDGAKGRRRRWPAVTANPEPARFYTRLMTDQLFGDRPLHLRRTLDQFYYFSARSTSARDKDQVVAKFGPEAAKVGSRPILMADQLWLWIVGGSTVVTCFDRSMQSAEDSGLDAVHANLLDHVLWKLGPASGLARRVQSAYELAHLVLYEASGFVFKYSYAIPRARRFPEIFRGAIGSVSNAQAELFADLERLCHAGPAMELSRRDQNELFDVSRELAQVKEARDIVDELVMVAHLYEHQLTIVAPLFDMQYSDALFWAGKADPDGNFLPRGSMVESDSSGLDGGSGTGAGSGGASSSGGSNNGGGGGGGARTAGLKSSHKWDERGWFKRTRQYMEKHRDTVVEMINETERVYSALRDTIDLKQNNASIYEAHSSRKETEAIMVFTLVSSFILPMSFFTSVFGMNVVEITDGSHVTLGVAMAYAIPLSLLLILFFVSIAFRRDVREWTLAVLSSNKKVRAGALGAVGAAARRRRRSAAAGFFPRGQQHGRGWGGGGGKVLTKHHHGNGGLFARDGGGGESGASGSASGSVRTSGNGSAAQGGGGGAGRRVLGGEMIV